MKKNKLLKPEVKKILKHFIIILLVIFFLAHLTIFKYEYLFNSFIIKIYFILFINFNFLGIFDKVKLINYYLLMFFIIFKNFLFKISRIITFS